MPSNRSTIELRLGARLSAKRGTTDLGPAPNESVALLALLLCNSSTDGLLRTTLARRLYPDSDVLTARVALRQSLARIRTWLGPDCVVAPKNSIARRGQWNFHVLTTTPLERQYGRPEWDSVYGNEPPSNVEFERNDPARLAETIEFVAGYDLDAARAIFINAQSLLTCLSPLRREQLLLLTRPKSRRDPFAFEYCEAITYLNNVTGKQHESIPWLLRAGRIANHTGNRTQIARAKAHLLFVHLETGNIPEAAANMTELNRESGRHRVLVNNARVAYFWNIGQTVEAIRLLIECARSVESGSRSDQLHFWVNAVTLSAEEGNSELFNHASAHAESLLLDGCDEESRLSLALGQGKMLAAEDPHAAKNLLEPLAKAAKVDGRLSYLLYELEGLALAYARIGDMRKTHSTWAKIRAYRTRPGWRLNPRHLALKKRIFASF